jgi:hypothetical protein
MNIRMFTLILAGTLLFFVNPGQAESAQRNGFSIQDPTIPLEEILSGGPPRDGIPSIDSPKFISAAEVDWLLPGSRVLGLEINGVIRAYPLAILNWHEIVNDSVGGVPLAVTYCPLCGTGMSFRRDFSGTVTTLGVSGLLYNSDLLLYDRESESLWSQVMGQSVSGPRKGERLITVPIEHSTWADWKNQHPQTEVLSKNTGFSRGYGRSPYGDYDENRDIFPPLSFRSSLYHRKERVIGIEFDGEFKAYHFAELSQLKYPLGDTFARQKITLEFNLESRNGIIRDPQGKVLPSVNAFWFAWYTFHPGTKIFSAKN